MNRSEWNSVLTYGGSFVSLAIAILLRWLLEPYLQGKHPYTLLFVAAGVTVLIGGYRLAMLIVLVGYIACSYLFVPTGGQFYLLEPQNLIELLLFLASSSVIFYFGESLCSARRDILLRDDSTKYQIQLVRTTLACIGDAVINTDSDSRVTTMNSTAEALTGWSVCEAEGNLLSDVFHIVSESSREKLEGPVLRAMKAGVLIESKNQSLLISKDGIETPIDDIASPIRNTQGDVVGCVLVFRDTSARHHVEAERQFAQEQIATTLESVTDGLMRYDAEWRIIYVNAEAERINRLTRAEMLGKVVWEVFPALVGTNFSAQFHRAVDEQVTVEFENYYEPFQRWYSLKGYPTPDGGLTTYIRDITEQKLQEEAVRRSEARLRRVFESNVVGMIRWDLDKSLILDANETFLRMSGYNREDLVAGRLNFRDMTPIEWTSRNEEGVRSIQTDGFAAPYEKEYFRKDGSRMPVIIAGTRFEDSPSEGMSILIDISESKRNEREIVRIASESERQRRLYETVLTNTPDFVYVFSLDHKVVYANDALIKMWGRGYEGAIGKTFLEIGYERWHAEMHDREIDQVRTTRQPIRGEVPFHGTHGRRIYEYIFVPVFGVDGEVEAVAGTTRDVTERRQAEEKQAFLVNLADRLRPLSDPIKVQAEASRVLGEFLRANRVVYFELYGDEYVIESDYSSGVPALAGRYSVHAFGPELLAKMLEGHTIVEVDATDESERPLKEREAFAAIQVRGHVDVPLVKHGKLVAGMSVQVNEGRDWTIHEIALIEETAERTWAAVERVRVETALHQSEERSAFVRQSSGVGFWYCDLPFDVLQWDELVKAHFHLPADSVVTIETFYDCLHPDDREQTREAIARSISIRTPYNIDYRTVNPETGDMKWVRAIGRTFYATDGTPTRFDGITLDVSDQKRAEANLRESEQRFREMANAAPAMIWVTNEKHECTFLSQNWFDFTGQNSGEDLRFRWIEAVHPDDQEAVKKAFFRAADKGTSFELDYRLRTKDGSYRWAIDAGKPRFDTAGKFCGFVGSVIDDHDRHEAQSALSDAREAAEAANKSKSAFLANMSHEIRTPMTAILGYADLLDNLVKQDDAIQHLQTIRRNGYYLLEIINDILDLSKIEAGKLDVESERFQPHRLIEDVRRIMDVRAKESNLSLAVQYEGKLPLVIQSDAKRLKQILINLVGNAIKFTHQGHVQIVVRFDASAQQLKFDVIDTGIGISPEQMKRLFSPFSQGDTSVSRNFGGTGLGLIISKRLAEMLQGSISASSTPGGGSTFSVSIATGEDADSNLVDYNTLNTEGDKNSVTDRSDQIHLSCHVLVVDDRRDIRYLSKHILTESGATVSECEDGLIAIENVSASLVHDNGPDLVLLDMQMPNLDGYATAQRLRELGYTGPIVALTADAMQGDMSKCIEVGCNDYLSKPIDKAQLLKKVEELTKTR